MNDVRTLTRSLVAVDTVDRAETTALDILAPLLADAGFTVSISEHVAGRGTLVANWNTDFDEPPLCLSGHVDTVPLGAAPWQHDPFGTETDGDRLYGRGTSDMKGGVAAIVTAAIDVAKHRPLRAGLRLILTAAEETGSHGARHVAASVGRCGPLMIAEPTANAVFNGHKGALWLQMSATGITAHGSTPALGDNAIYTLARAISRLADHRFDVTHPVLGAPTLNVGTVEGGLNVNSVPDRATASIDVRTVTGQDHQHVREELAAVAGTALVLSPLVDLPAVWTDPENSWARSVAEIARDVTGESGGPRAATYFTDASVLTPALGGVPTLICGPGQPELAHVTDEWCSMERLDESVAIYRRVIQEWCQL